MLGPALLSVVSFVASIVQYLERSFFIISYFSFGFTSAYNSIVFCCLRRNVKPCCHTHDLLWLCIVRERAWSVSHCGLSHVALGGPIPALNKKPAAGAIYNHGAAVIDREAR